MENGQVFAYIRVSKNEQDTNNQRHEILEYTNKENLRVEEDNFIKIEISSRKNSKQRRIDELVEKLQSGDTLIVTELSRLGRSTGEVIELIKRLVEYGVRVVVLKQNLDVSAETQNLASKVLITVFALLAELERDFISLRTKEALAAKKAEGVNLGKPKGTIQESMYDKDRKRIEELLALKMPKTTILEHLGYGTLNSFYHYLNTRGLREVASK